MANNDYITTDCKLTVSKNTAKLDEEIFLYKNDRNIKLLIEIVDNKYRYKSDDLSNLLVKYKASYAQVKWYKNAEVKKEFPIQATDDGKVVFVIEGQLIDEDTELGDYDLQLRLLNESQESIRSLPIIKGAVHILKPLFEEGDIATVNSAVADVSMLSLDGDAIDTYNSDGTYNQTNWGSGDIISSSKLNKLEKVAKDNVDKVNKMPAKSIVEGGKIYLAKEDGTKLDSGTELSVGGSTIEVVNNLESDSTTAALSAAQGKALNTQYKDIANLINNGNISNNNLPNIFFTGDTSGMSKEVKKILQINYRSQNINFDGYVTLKWQGSSSLKYDKKNYTMNIFEDLACANKKKIDFRWGKQSKYCLKANYIDMSTHAKNIVSANLWSEIVKSRKDYNSLPQELRESPNNGAIDGFPVNVYINDEYHGVYTLNIPKDGWMFNMDKNNSNHCVICADAQNGAASFRATISNFNTAWGLEFPDKENPMLVTSFNNLIKCIKDTDNATFKSTISNYLDVQSAIDYYIFMYLNCNTDGLGKNLIMCTYDGVIWRCSAYDMDSIWGANTGGAQVYLYNRKCPEEYECSDSLLFARLEECFATEMVTRYNELRKSILSFGNVVAKLDDFMKLVKTENYERDCKKWGKTYSNPFDTLCTFISKRNGYVDGEMANLIPIPITAIELDNTSLIVPYNGEARLTATLTPSNSNGTITWSCNNENVTIAPNGLTCIVSGKTIGTSVITATSAEDSSIKATCNISVENVVVNIEDIKISGNNTVGTGKNITLTATITPSNATNKNVNWNADNNNVTITPNGLTCTVKGVTVGNTIITVTTKDGSKSATFNITVKEAIADGDLYTLRNNKEKITTDVKLIETKKDFTVILKTVAPTDMWNIYCIQCQEDGTEAALTYGFIVRYYKNKLELANTKSVTINSSPIAGETYRIAVRKNIADNTWVAIDSEGNKYNYPSMEKFNATASHVVNIFSNVTDCDIYSTALSDAQILAKMQEY